MFNNKKLYIIHIAWILLSIIIYLSKLFVLNDETVENYSSHKFYLTIIITYTIIYLIINNKVVDHLLSLRSDKGNELETINVLIGLFISPIMILVGLYFVYVGFSSSNDMLVIKSMSFVYLGLALIKYYFIFKEEVY